MVNIKSTSNAIWWIKNPKAGAAARGKDDGKRKESLGSSFCLDMVDLLRNISLQGYSKLVAPELPLGARLIWLLVHVATFVTLVVVLSLTWEQFVAQYFVINLKDPLYPVQNVPFPAVSICSNNRISRQRATKYALELQRSDPTPRELDYYLENLELLRDFYTTFNKTIKTDSYVSFQSFLDIYGTWDNETFFSTRRIMKMLTPRCEDYILKCSVSNVNIPCFSKDAFQESLTAYGPCCTFNADNTLKTRSYKNRLASAELGLTVLINSSKTDYFAHVLNTDSYVVMIHSPENYASVRSSNIREMFPGHNEESFLEINARVMTTDKGLDSFSPLSRRCYFDHEAPNPDQLLRSTYTFSNCITRCRIRSVIALCRCMPFYMPLKLVENVDGLVYCTLSHIRCILDYNFKWNNVLIERQFVPGLEREMEEALFCPQCMPSCDDVQYSVSVSSIPLDNFLASLTPENITELSSDISVLHVYFGAQHAMFFIRLLNNAWFEAFSTIGNILSIIIGFSLVAIFELLFILLKYVYMGGRRIVEQSQNDKKALDPAKLYIYP